MKPSSSVSCGCCFCCYCRSWLMMLLMVSSVIHVSPEMMTAITTKTDTNLNNYYKAMTKFAKFNSKLPSQSNEVEPSSAQPLADTQRNTIPELYPALQSDMIATLATMQTHFTISKTPTTTPATTITTTTTSSLLGQIAVTRQSSYETRARARTTTATASTTTGPVAEEEIRNSVYRSSTNNPSTPALTGDNYDVVIQTTDTPASMPKSTETLGEKGTTNVQIAPFHGDSKNPKYPRVESNSSQHSGTTSAETTIVTQHAQRPKGNHVGAASNQMHNIEEVQKTITGQRITATVSSSSKLTKQNTPQPSRKDQITISSLNNSNKHARDMSVSSQLQTTHSDLQPWHRNQLKRPALLAASTQPRTLLRQTRQADDEPIDKCRLFEVGDPEKMELYSPDYPNVYPKNINCTRVITAQKGQIIRLDFRNSFHIEEKEDCKFDFLEIRDGQYGFSNLIGKFCGTDFPPEITSKERYLWLHFHSDESIEYSGFTAVYEFIDRTRDAPSTDLNCTIEKGGDEGFVNSTDIPQEIRDTVAANKIALDCMWRIQVQEKWKIQVKFLDFKLSKPNDCDVNFLDIFPEQTVMPLRVKNFCGSAGEGITSESNILHMRFYAEQQAVNSTFSILYTAFRDRGSGSCAENEYDCEDATCIAADLKCNQRDNCKFRWDEEGCEPESKGQSEHMTIIITVFGLILGGMVITFLVNCVRKIMHDQKIIREHIRQSKESKLDEMGRNSKARSRDNISIVSPRQKHSQTSLQILDDVSNRYYREIELQTKGNFKEKEPPNLIRRHDMIVQTSLCSTDDSSTTTAAEQPPPGPAAVPQPNACDMGCQTRESLFATASLLRSKSKTPSLVGGHRSVEGVPPPPRFSTFGYDAAQMTAQQPTFGTTSTLSRRNIHLPQGSIETDHPQNQEHMTMVQPQQQQQQ
uniref:CUB domain-containing protein n=1 Tax=Musca domestica TaxID=7370 RepID=A0A1I8MQJ6_MUSDO